MVLQMFSVPEHIPKILQGMKTQTTRKGIRDIAVCTKLQQYFKPRMKKGSCRNCIVKCNTTTEMQYRETFDCPGWNNFLGEVPVTEIIHYPSGLQELNKTDFEEWAIADGFDSGEQADEWFTDQYGIGWRAIPMTVIKWDNRGRVMR